MYPPFGDLFDIQHAHDADNRNGISDTPILSGQFSRLYSDYLVLTFAAGGFGKFPDRR